MWKFLFTNIFDININPNLGRGGGGGAPPPLRPPPPTPRVDFPLIAQKR